MDKPDVVPIEDAPNALVPNPMAYQPGVKARLNSPSNSPPEFPVGVIEMSVVPMTSGVLRSKESGKSFDPVKLITAANTSTVRLLLNTPPTLAKVVADVTSKR